MNLPVSKRFHDACLYHRIRRPWVPVETFKLPLCVRKAGCSCKYAFDLKGKRIFLLCILDKNLVCFVYYIKTRRIKRFELDCNFDKKCPELSPIEIHQVFYCSNNELFACITLSNKREVKESYAISWEIKSILLEIKSILLKMKRNSWKIEKHYKLNEKVVNVGFDCENMCYAKKDGYLYVIRLNRNKCIYTDIECDGNFIPKEENIKDIFFNAKKKILAIVAKNNGYYIYFYRLASKQGRIHFFFTAKHDTPSLEKDEIFSCFFIMEEKSNSLMLTRIKPMCQNGENFTVEIYGELFSQQGVKMKQNGTDTLKKICRNVDLLEFMLKGH